MTREELRHLIKKKRYVKVILIGDVWHSCITGPLICDSLIQYFMSVGVLKTTFIFTPTFKHIHNLYIIYIYIISQYLCNITVVIRRLYIFIMVMNVMLILNF